MHLPSPPHYIKGSEVHQKNPTMKLSLRIACFLLLRPSIQTKVSKYVMTYTEEMKKTQSMYFIAREKQIPLEEIWGLKWAL